MIGLDKKKLTVDILIKVCEGIRLKAYQDSAGIWTIGIGQAKYYPDGTTISEGDTCIESEAYVWLNLHLNKYVYPAVNELQGEYGFNDKIYASLCSFAYNLGASHLKDESITAALESADLDQLAGAFRKYIYAGGHVIEGLKNRREIEIDNFYQVD